MRTIVISPIGEPGAGKSTFSFWLTAQLKLRGISTEFVPEVIKYESYSPEAMARVVSGKFDQRLLRKQHALTKPLVGKVEVIVNDGALPPFFYYSLLRVPADRLPALRAQLDRYMEEQQPADHRYVLPQRNHPYEKTGRRQTEVESARLRADLLATLHREFAIEPTPLGDWDMRTRYVQQLADEVIAARTPRSLSRPARP